MSEINITLQQLRGLIGLRVLFQETVWQIIEILEDGPSLVLQALDDHSTIQANQHGDANRRVPRTVTLPVLSDDRLKLSADLLALDLLDELSE